MLQYIFMVLFSLGVSRFRGRGTGVLGVSARELADEGSSHVQSTVMTLHFTFSDAESSEDVTGEMRSTICTQILKHSLFELDIPDDNSVQCEHNVDGFPVKVTLC